MKIRALFPHEYWPSSLRLAWPPSLAAMKLRPKLIFAFVAMAIMAGLCGTVGLLFVSRIGATVAVFSDVTSRLLMESTTLIENAQRMRAAFLEATSKGERTEAVTQQLDKISAESRQRLETLRELAAQGAVSLRLEETEQHQQAFVQTLNAMIAAYGREQRASSMTQERFAQFETTARDLDALLLALANRAEGKIITSEDEARVQVQTGSATVDGLGDLFSDVITETYPLLQSAYKLMREIVHNQDMAQSSLVQTNLGGLAAIEQKTKKGFRTTSAVLKKLAGRLRDADGKAELAQIVQGFAEFETALLGPEGAFAGRREVLAARMQIATGDMVLDQIQRDYFNILGDVERAVRGLNENARNQATNGIAQAHTTIAVVVLLTTLAGLAFGLFFAHRITGPLVRLAGHVVNIRERGELTTAIDPSVVNRTDEIGTLSRSFNAMITELADARRRLIAWSEAEIRTQYERLNAALSNMTQGLCMLDADRKLIICNNRYAELYRLKPEHTVAGTPLRDILEHQIAAGTCPENVQGYVEGRIEAVAERTPWYQVKELRDGRVIAVAHQPMAGGGSVSTHENITERRKAEAQIAHMAHHDALTNLPNRVRFRQDMDKALTRVGRGEGLAVLCLDLDQFKSVNDTLGHPIGDTLLQVVAERLLACVRSTDIVARLGGDEFAIVQVATDQPIDSTALATRLIEAIATPFDLQGHQVVIGTSIGIAIAPNDGEDPDQLLKNADMALYRAKEDGRGRYRFFEAAMDARMQARRALELDLRKAVALGEFELFYQPLIQLASKTVTGFEALLRWRHPQRGLVPPTEFIALAEETGLIGPIGAWALKQACAEAMTWPDHIKVAVNLSPMQFKNRAVILDVIAALGASRLPAHRLELEITETVLLQDTEATISTLRQLRDLGVRIAMDDFGTGYSSLSYLRKFPFDKIKIDRSFIHDLTDEPDSLAIVRAVTGLGASLGMATTAEGVETEEQLQQLMSEGCTEVQGFLFSQARPAAELKALLERLDPSLRAVA